jgi:hypothetical protein
MESGAVPMAIGGIGHIRFMRGEAGALTMQFTAPPG